MGIQDFLDCSITELEQATGIQKAQWSHYFHERRSMSIRTLCRLANKLDMSPDLLLIALLLRIEKQSQVEDCSPA